MFKRPRLIIVSITSLAMSGCLLFSGCSDEQESSTSDSDGSVSSEISTTEEAEAWSAAVKEQLSELAYILLEPEEPLSEDDSVKKIITIDFKSKQTKDQNAGSSILIKDSAYSFSKRPV